MPRRHLVQHRAEAEQVRARVEFFAPRLLGGHVSHRTHGHAWAGEVFLSNRRCHARGLCWYSFRRRPPHPRQLRQPQNPESSPAHASQ